MSNIYNYGIFQKLLRKQIYTCDITFVNVFLSPTFNYFCLENTIINSDAKIAAQPSIPLKI